MSWGAVQEMMDYGVTMPAIAFTAVVLPPFAYVVFRLASKGWHDEKMDFIRRMMKGDE